MNVKIKQIKEKKFEPFTLEITVTSQEELDHLIVDFEDKVQDSFAEFDVIYEALARENSRQKMKSI
ncbi:MAG: hypothetical protein ACOC2U_00205 [bacterium]